MTTKLKKRPPQWPPGTLKDTIFMGDPDAINYSFNLEQVDTDLFELTIFILDSKKARTEYTINVNSQALEVLQHAIGFILEDANSHKRSV